MEVVSIVNHPNFTTILGWIFASIGFAFSVYSRIKSNTKEIDLLRERMREVEKSLQLQRGKLEEMQSQLMQEIHLVGKAVSRIEGALKIKVEGK